MARSPSIPPITSLQLGMLQLFGNNVRERLDKVDTLVDKLTARADSSTQTATVDGLQRQVSLLTSQVNALSQQVRALQLTGGTTTVGAPTYILIDGDACDGEDGFFRL